MTIDVTNNSSNTQALPPLVPVEGTNGAVKTYGTGEDDVTIIYGNTFNGTSGTDGGANPVLLGGGTFSLLSADVDAASSDVVSGGSAPPSYEDTKALADSAVDSLPPGEQEQYREIIDRVDRLHNQFADTEGQSLAQLFLLLIILLIDTAKETRLGLRQAAFAQLEASVSSLEAQASEIESGAAKRFIGAVVSAAITIGVSLASVTFVSKANLEKANANIPEESDTRATFQTLSQKAQAAQQGGASAGQLVQGSLEYTASLDDAEGKRDEARSRELQYTSDESKNTAQALSEQINDQLQAAQSLRSTELENAQTINRNTA